MRRVVLVIIALTTLSVSVSRGQGPGYSSSPSVLAMDLNNNATAFAYGFNATNLGGGSYLSIFDAESWQLPVGSAGDSTGARYGSAYNFGFRGYNQDLLVGRTTTSSNYMNWGASNPQLIYSGSTWAVYWLDVTQSGGRWRHNLMLGMVAAGSMSDILSASMLYHATGDTNVWANPVRAGQGALVEQPIGNPLPDAEPVYETDGAGNRNGQFVRSSFSSTNENLTAGLIGSITSENTGVLTEHQYLYYTDEQDPASPGWCPAGCLVRRRIESQFLTNVSTPEVVLDFSTVPVGRRSSSGSPYMVVNYHWAIDKYVVAYNCEDRTLFTEPAGPGDIYPDICIQTLGRNASNVFDFASLASTIDFKHNTYGVGLRNDAGIPKDAAGQFTVNQFGVRKDGWGNHFTDADGQLILYIPVAPFPNDLVPWHLRGVYAKRVNLY